MVHLTTVLAVSVLEDRMSVRLMHNTSEAVWSKLVMALCEALYWHVRPEEHRE